MWQVNASDVAIWSICLWCFLKWILVFVSVWCLVEWSWGRKLPALTKWLRPWCCSRWVSLAMPQCFPMPSWRASTTCPCLPSCPWCPWLVSLPPIAIATVMEPQVQPSLEWKAAGFFDHWTFATWIVTVSFTSKSLITLYLLKSLDGIQKNVGEAGLFLVVFSPNVELRRTSWTQSYWILGVIWGPQHPTRTFPNGFPNGFPKRFPKDFHKKPARHLAVIVIFVGQIAAGSSVFRSLCIFVGLSGRAPGSNLWPGW